MRHAEQDVVLESLTHTRQIGYDWHAQRLQDLAGPDARRLQKLWGADHAGREDHFLPRRESVVCT